MKQSQPNQTFLHAAAQLFESSPAQVQKDLTPVFTALDRFGLYPLFRSVEFGEAGPGVFYAVRMKKTDFYCHLSFSCPLSGAETSHFAVECGVIINTVPATPTTNVLSSLEDLNPHDPVDVQGFINELHRCLEAKPRVSKPVKELLQAARAISYMPGPPLPSGFEFDEETYREIVWEG